MGAYPVEGAEDVAGLEDAADHAAVGAAAEAEVAHVVGEHVVAGVVQDAVVGDEGDLDVVAGRGQCDFHGSRCEGRPARLNHSGWLAMMTFVAPGAGMNQPPAAHRHGTGT